MWIATNGGGVNYLDLKTKTISLFNDPEGVLNTVYAIVPARDESLWFSTNHGIVHYDPFRNSIRTYDERDGLQANNFNVGATYRNASGEIFFGGTNGLNIFQPQKVLHSTSCPDCLVDHKLSGNEVFYRNVSSAVELILPSTASNISFEFAVLDYCELRRMSMHTSWLDMIKSGIMQVLAGDIIPRTVSKIWIGNGTMLVPGDLVNYDDLPDGKLHISCKRDQQ